MKNFRSETEKEAAPGVSRRGALLGLAGTLPIGLAMGGETSTAAAADQAAESTWDRIKRTRVLRVDGIVGEEPNFHKDPQTGEWSGFAIDMGRSIAKALDVELQIIESTWGGSVLDLQAGKIDIAFTLQATPQRALAIGFAGPMYAISLIIIPRKGFTKSTWAELDNPDVRLAVDVGSVHEAIARRYAPKAQIISFKNRDEAVLAVVSGRADANVSTTLNGILSHSKNPDQLGEMITPTPVLTLSSFFGVRVGDTRWAEFLSIWGTYNRELGQTREWILDNLKLSGITPDDVPSSVQF
jgi:polar amino acid transport system substrate-binding protein